jgi:RNA polymerase sigma-70 factor (ECF subfamily)
LVRLCRADGDEGFELLYRRYAPALRAVCVRRLQWSSSEADDAVQETFLRARRSLSAFRDDARLWPWLVSISINVCRDLGARRERFMAAEESPAPVPDPASDFSRHAARTLLSDALGTLSPRLSVPLVLREMMDWTYQDIAEALGVSVASVRTNLMRGRRQLRAHLEAVIERTGEWPLVVAGRGAWERCAAFARNRRLVGALPPEGALLMVAGMSALLGVGSMSPAGTSAPASGSSDTAALGPLAFTEGGWLPGADAFPTWATPTNGGRNPQGTATVAADVVEQSLRRGYREVRNGVAGALVEWGEDGRVGDEKWHLYSSIVIHGPSEGQDIVNVSGGVGTACDGGVDWLSSIYFPLVCQVGRQLPLPSDIEVPYPSP